MFWAYNAGMAFISVHRRNSVLLLAFIFLCAVVHAQDNPTPASTDADSKPVGVAQDASAQTPAEITNRCWQMLTDTVEDTKHLDNRILALHALGDLGSNPRANHLLEDAMKDTSLDVRTAAVLAAGNSKSRALIPAVTKLLDDPEPQVVFVAATTLWKQFNDKSGEDVLAAIAAGDRKANPNLIHGAEHDMSRTMHSPSALAKIGITTGAGMVLGPFGFSVAAIEYARKNHSDSARVQAINLLAEEKTEAVREQMQSSLADNDPGVRATAAKVLGNFHRHEDAAAIANLLNDSKPPVRLAAAAAYIDCLSGSAMAKTPHSHR